MKTRFITGMFITIVYVGVLCLAMYVHPIFFDIFLFGLAMGGTYEMYRALSNAFSPPILLLDMIAAALGFGAFWLGQYFFMSYASGMAAYFVALTIMVLVTLLVVSCSKNLVKGNAISTIFVMMYPTALLMFSAGLNAFIDVRVGGVNGSTPFRNAGITLMFLVPTFTDIMAYLIGSKLRGPKLCPSISPNKTISGAVGGLFGGMLGAGIVLLFMFLAQKCNVNILGLTLITDTWAGTIVNMLILGLVGSVFDQAGDLFASYIKRKSGIKDYSKLLPGHGGVLDRVDGFMFCGVFYYMYFAIMILL